MSAPKVTWPPELALVGVTRIVRYRVTPADSVRVRARRSVEFVAKPAVMASGALLEQCEAPCMDALRGSGVGPHECSLGVWQRLEHCAPIAIGARLTITARCAAARGVFTEWVVAVRDEHEPVGHATLGFVVVDRAEFERRRLLPKTALPEPRRGSEP